MAAAPSNLHGILVLDKPSGWTSHDVVAKTRGITHQRRIGHTGTLAYVPWPEWDESLLVENVLEVPVQVQGKLRGKVEVPADADAATVLKTAKEDPKVAPHLEGKTIVKIIFVSGKILNLVVR